MGIDGDDASGSEAGWHGAFDTLSGQLQLPPLALRSQVDDAVREMVRWRDLARALAHELGRDEHARDAAPPGEPGP
jgi:hypothetical protein